MPLQDLLPAQIKRPPTIADLPAPPIAAMTPLGPIPSDISAPPAPLNVTPNPRLSTVSSDPLTTRASQLNADLYNRTNPVAPTTTLGKIGHVAANVGNVLGDIFAPDTLALIPGTQLYNERIQARDKADLGQVSQLQTAADQRAGTEANTAYTQQRPAIEQAKIQQKITAANNKNAANVSKAGFVQNIDPETGVATFDEDPTSQAYQDRVSLSAMHDATAEKSQIQADIDRNHYVPGTPEYVEAQRKLGQADQRLHVALAGLGLKAQGLQLRRENQAATLYGKDADGNYLPGTPMISDGNGNNVGVGSKNAAHAITQQQQVGSFNDLSGSVDHTEGALKAMFASGGHLTDPDVISALADHNTPVAQWIGGLVASGLSPQKIAAVTAIRQNHEQAGILRKATGGTASEAGSQRILETAPGAGDTDEIALSKVAEQKNVRDRLAPGMTGVAGGVSVAGKNPAAPRTSQPSGSTPKEGTTKTNSAGDKIVFKGGKWGPT